MAKYTCVTVAVAFEILMLNFLYVSLLGQLTLYMYTNSLQDK